MPCRNLRLAETCVVGTDSTVHTYGCHTCMDYICWNIVTVAAPSSISGVLLIHEAIMQVSVAKINQWVWSQVQHVT